MKRLWTIIGVRDVALSFRWYATLFGQPEALPAHEDFGQILDDDGKVLLCLHQWADAAKEGSTRPHEHPTLMSASTATPGNGLLLFFRVTDFAQTLERAQTLGSQFAEEVHLNPFTQAQEFSLRDPDGYYVTISASVEED